MTTTSNPTPAAPSPKPAPKPASPKSTAKKVAASNGKPAKKATPKPKPQGTTPQDDAARAELTRRVKAARERGHTCRSIARLALPGQAEGAPGTPVWKLAGQLDRITRGSAASPEHAAVLIPVLDRIERGEVPLPERAPKPPAKRAQAIDALERARAAKSLAEMRQLLDEALGFLGAVTASKATTTTTTK